MSKDIYPSYPPSLTEARKQFILETVRDWSIARGLAVRPPPSFIDPKHDPAGVLATSAPVTLFPSLFPRSAFDEATSIQKAYNDLYASITMDKAWLQHIVSEIVGIDEFVGQLWKVHEAVAKEGYAQDLNLGLFRSDYMVHIENGKPGLKQVEFNTIASSFGGLSGQVAKLHKHLLASQAYPDEIARTVAANNLPSSSSISGLASGLTVAHRAYTARSTRPTCVLFVVQDGERNVFDQRLIEYALLEDAKVPSFRLPFSETLKHTRVESDRSLVYILPHNPEQSYEVSVVYYRAGYAPTDYEWPEAWQARLHLERSSAIKCPGILTHLAGCKKVQQVLATPGSSHLQNFVQDTSLRQRIWDTFAPIYPVDDTEAGTKAKELALNAETATHYVLKPQREGGGNNVYRAAIPDFLKSIPEAQWPAYILMEMIETPPQRNIILRNGEVQEGGVICELGVYGVCLWKIAPGNQKGGEILHSENAGYLLRTKGDQSEEGGVAAGFGAMDSCCLVDV